MWHEELSTLLKRNFDMYLEVIATYLDKAFQKLHREK